MGSSMSSSDYYASLRTFYFDPDVDSPKKTQYYVTNYILRKLLPEVVDISEKINEVRYYTHPMHSWQLSKYFFNHVFIVLKTDNWWWSIEKDVQGITIQRSKHLERVRDKRRKYDRVKGIRNVIDEVKKAPGNFTVNDLLIYLLRKDYMELNYHFLDNNCASFADTIFKLF